MCVCAKSPRLCLTLCNPVDCIPPDSCVHGVPQVRILEGVRFPSQGLFPDPGVKPVSFLSPVRSYALVLPYDLACIYSGLLLSHKKGWISAICSKMDTARDDHTKWNQTEKDEYHMMSLTCRIWKSGTNEPIYKTNRITDIENKHRYQGKERTWGGINLRDWDSQKHSTIYKIDN